MKKGHILLIVIVLGVLCVLAGTYPNPVFRQYITHPATPIPRQSFTYERSNGIVDIPDYGEGSDIIHVKVITVRFEKKLLSGSFKFNRMLVEDENGNQTNLMTTASQINEGEWYTFVCRYQLNTELDLPTGPAMNDQVLNCLPE